MKIRKRISIVADILVDEDFDTNYLCICEMIDTVQTDVDIFIGRSDNFEVLDYISQEAVELDGNRKVRCNDCMWDGCEADLIISSDGESEQCPNCKRDDCLMDD